MFSNSYTFYPDNKALEQAIEYYKSISSETDSEDLAADTKVALPDIFINTRGNFEQHKYSAKVYPKIKDALLLQSQTLLANNDDEQWVNCQNSLANIIAAMAQQSQDEALYEQAITVLSTTLDTLTQESHAQQWAQTQYNLATVYQALGRIQKSSQWYKKAVDSYTDVTLAWTRDNNALDWATTMHQLGDAFHGYGLLLKGNRTFQKSVVAYKNALAEFDADNTPLELASSHNNRAIVLLHLGESEQNSGRVEEAIRSFSKALLVVMEQQQPFHLAVLCRINKATAQTVLAQMNKDAVLAEEIADEYELMLACFENSLQPLSKIYCEQQYEKCTQMVKDFK